MLALSIRGCFEKAQQFDIKSDIANCLPAGNPTYSPTPAQLDNKSDCGKHKNR